MMRFVAELVKGSDLKPGDLFWPSSEQCDAAYWDKACDAVVNGGPKVYHEVYVFIQLPDSEIDDTDPDVFRITLEHTDD